MSENQSGHVEAAEILDTRQEKYEESSEIANILPDGFRVIETSNGGGYTVERSTEYKGYWTPIARFTNSDAKYEWADEIQDNIGGSEYRCVVDRTEGEVYLEAWVDDE